MFAGRKVKKKFSFSLMAYLSLPFDNCSINGDNAQLWHIIISPNIE
jgi:hypothetical protein